MTSLAWFAEEAYKHSNIPFNKWNDIAVAETAKLIYKWQKDKNIKDDYVKKYFSKEYHVSESNMITAPSIDCYVINRLQEFIITYKHEGFNLLRIEARVRVMRLLEDIKLLSVNAKSNWLPQPKIKSDQELYAHVKKLNNEIVELDKWLTKTCWWPIIPENK